MQMQGTGGLYEFGTIQSVGGGSVTLTTNLASAYYVGGNAKAQLLRVGNYQDLTVLGGGVITAHPWDGSTGGVVAFRVSGVLTVAASGVISVNEQGYRGAPTNTTGYGGTQGEGQTSPGIQSTSANGTGGGGGCSQGFGNPAGGGGGGYGTTGTTGNPGNNNNCDVGGAGGGTAGLADLSSVALFGGGAGSGGAKADCGCPGGYGGTGGGTILAFASVANINGTISANGSDGAQGSGSNLSANGGGGAGGSIRLVVGSGSTSTPLSATFGSGAIYGGGSSQDGGNGGSGRIHVQYCESFTGTSNPPANVEALACTPPDDDADGVPNDSDNCPSTPNPGQENNVHPGTPAGDHCEDPEPDSVFDIIDNCPDVANGGQENTDGDQWGDACETADCIAVPTLWATPPGDGDCDGWTTTVENFIGTDPLDACGPPADVWPVDIDDNQVVTIADVGFYVTILNEVGPNPPNPNYLVRFDLNMDVKITIADVGFFVTFLNKSCTP